MDRRVIEQKLETLRYCVQRVAQRCPDHPNQLQQDPDTQDIIALNLSRAVQQCVDIGAHLVTALELPPPDTMGQTFDRLAEGGIIEASLADRLKKAVGFRNIAVHNYERIKRGDRSRRLLAPPRRLPDLCTHSQRTPLTRPPSTGYNH